MDFIIDNFNMLFDSEEGLKKLDEMILDLAVKGKIVEQDLNDEPASVLIEKIEIEKERLIKEKVIKKPKKLEPISEEEKPFDIPESWEWVRLGNIGLAQTGTTPSVSRKEYYNGQYPFIKPGDISIEGINYQNESLTEDGIAKARLINKNSLMMVCIGGSIGKSYFIDRNCACNQQINTLTGFLNIDSKFIFYFTRAKYFYNSMLKKATGTATPIINKGKWETLLFPLPPLTQQKRIVEKIDSLKKLVENLRTQVQIREKTRGGLKKSIMAEIEKSCDNKDLLKNLELVFQNFDVVVKKKEDIKDIRDLVLSMAVKGKLVEQDPTDEPASVLIEKIEEEKKKLIAEKKIKKPKELEIISEEEKPFELPENWEWVRLGEVLELLSGRDISSTKCNDKGVGTPYIMGASNMKNDSLIIQRWIENPVVTGIKGDLLVSCKGTIGNIQIQKIEKTHLSRQLMGLRVFEGLSNLYLEIFMREFVKKLKDSSKGLIPGISRDDILLIKFALPPLAEQKRIVERVDKLMELCDRLEEQVVKSQEEMKGLMRSVMQLGK